ncbi:MAG: hypothetical protein DKT66_01830 [Candidatus Melainabacteria bacterium]|nr:MAG: hypothetical protein DKT66_01830 [Candidatus Melainabacteria bacterium]
MTARRNAESSASLVGLELLVLVGKLRDLAMKVSPYANKTKRSAPEPPMKKNAYMCHVCAR